MDTVATMGAEGFLAGLRDLGFEPISNGAVVTFEVVPVTGARAGMPVPTGVNKEELATWPMTPPHWVHLPAEVVLARMNTNGADTLPGWTRHSRQIANWGDAADPAQAWVAHSRAVLGEATA
jgi:hypothetical protein